MPNWCSVNIEMVGPTEQLSKLADIVNAEDSDIGLLETIAPPIAPDEPSYDWCVENWGTKWEVGGGHAELEQLATAHPYLQSKLSICTESAWSPPLEALNTFQEANPELFVKCWYYEPGMDYAGLWDGGAEDMLDNLHCDSIDWTKGVAAELDEQFGICEEHAQYDEEIEHSD